jgi:glutaredoxin-related protein
MAVPAGLMVVIEIKGISIASSCGERPKVVGSLSPVRRTAARYQVLEEDHSHEEKRLG